MQTVTEITPENNNRDGEHILINLTYIGKNTGKNDGIKLIRALEQWRIRNKASDVTSAIAINNNYFIQSIEGSRPAINQTLAKLLSEYPHFCLHVVESKEIEVRSWDGFLIKYLNSGDQDEDYALKSFSAGSDFNPYLMKKDQITSFLKAIFEEKESQVDSTIQC